PPREQRHGRIYNAIERMFDSWLRVYDRTLRLTLRFRAGTMMLSLALVVITGYLFVVLPKGFLPSEDQGRVRISTEGAPGIGLKEMVRHETQMNEIVMKDPAVFSSHSVVSSSNQGFIEVDLVPRSRRKVTLDQVIQRLRPQLAQVTGIRALITNP